MLFSVIIPTCNRNDSLAACLNALAPNVQNVPGDNYEVIVTDDGQADEGRNLVETQYDWIQWCRGPKKGPAANRNNGAKQAKGEWLVFIDDDCLPNADLLHQYLYFSVQHPRVDVMEGCIYSDKKIPLLYAAPTNTEGGYLWSCNFAIRSNIFKKLQGFDENYKYANLEDNDLYKRLRQYAFNVEFAADAKVYHPPRRIPPPAQFARLHESWFYYHAKFGEPKTVYDLMKTVSRYRLREIWRAPKNFTSLRALKFLFQELFFSWKKHRHLRRQPGSYESVGSK